MNGKDGLFRNNLSGKRRDFTARTVIGPDPRLRADEIAIPEEFAERLTFPEKINAINLKKMEEIVNTGKANFVKRDDKVYDLKYNLTTRATYESGGFSLEEGDMVLREGKKIDPVKFKLATGKDITILPTDKIARGGKILKNIKPSERVPFELETNDKIFRNHSFISPEQIRASKGSFEYKQGDRVYRNGKELKSVIFPQKRYFKLKIGDTVERHLKNGDIVLFGRQPTLHKGSIIARKVKIIKNTTGINGHRTIRTVRMNLAQNKTHNAD